MESTAAPSVPAPPLLLRLVKGGAIFLLLGVGGYFLLTRLPRYFVLAPESYGPYFWPRASWLLPHVVFGLIATLAGPFQFVARIRREHPTLHRMTGRIYLVSVALGAVAALGLAFTTSLGWVYSTGLLGLAAVWLTTSGLAFAAIRRRRIAEHQRWMIRSYVVTFAFITFRVFEDGLAALGVGTQVERLTLAAWASWAVPLFVTQVVLEARSIFGGHASRTSRVA
ncbi:MAG TPA: DUF2306 domain-containing protein [Gemmatimonadaceae bacterium]|nr:DUF2306 domain-containing protein [Gemmatimonadaceae bacterium]